MATLKVTGLAELKSALGTLPGRVPARVVAPAIAAALEPIARDARSSAPVRSGRLRRAIRVVMGRVQAGSVSGEVGVRQTDLGKPYAGPEELGAHDRRGRHFLGKAFDRRKARALRDLEVGIARGIEDQAARH